MKTNLKKLKTIFLALLVMALWGSLFPCVKIGYKAFEIDSMDIPSILVFAGTRFSVCGIVICGIAFLKKDKIKSPKGKSIAIFILVGFFSIILHYAFTYIGLSLTDASKSALIKQIGSLIYVCFAFFFFKNETFNVWKIWGAIIGFLGIVVINFDADGVEFSLGDILLILASICTVVSGILSKKIIGENSPFWLTGISQFFGGIILMLIAFFCGAKMLTFNWENFAVFAYICFASMIAYVLWNYILKTSELSNMFIIKFSEPLFACFFGAILLNENIFQWQYLLAFVLIALGIIFGNTQKKEIKDEG